ncbi:MAG TPA: FtsX-like permease family protein [Gammaproteobacteria bacterium]|nr:FtsX-like permease family protein [Gammaproteobacteria bacterium]
MRIHPIISSLRHHRLTTFLLMLQIACTCAIVCNAVFLIVNRIEQVNLPSGLAENQLSVISSEDIRKDDNAEAQQAADLAVLRALPGVQSAAAIMNGSLPLNRNSSSTFVCATQEDFQKAVQDNAPGPHCVEPSEYAGTPGTFTTLGLHLVEGRQFEPDEYITESLQQADAPTVMIISRSLAQRLYPEQDAVGQSAYVNGKPMHVVGIVDHLLRPYLDKPATNYYSMLWPVSPNSADAMYILRSASQDRQQVLKAAVAALNKLNPERLIQEQKTYDQIRHTYFQRDVTMIGLLLASVSGLLFVTALGITGLASFWVQQRTKQIGIRRAIGATRGDILHYFQLENFLIVSTGIAFGLTLAVALNLTLMRYYEIPRLSWFYLPISAVVLWLLGQLAILNPALRAASVSPVTATRNV